MSRSERKKAYGGDRDVRSDAESLPAQVGQLSGDATKLLEEHLRLFKVEMKEEFSAYLRDGLILGLGGLVATVGFALLSSLLALAVFFVTPPASSGS